MLLPSSTWIPLRLDKFVVHVTLQLYVGVTPEHWKHKVLVGCAGRNSNVIFENRRQNWEASCGRKNSFGNIAVDICWKKIRNTYPPAFDNQKFLHQLKVYLH